MLSSTPESWGAISGGKQNTIFNVNFVCTSCALWQGKQLFLVHMPAMDVNVFEAFITQNDPDDAFRVHKLWGHK